MRANWHFLLFLLALGLTLYQLRHHVRDACQLIYMYGSFHRHLAKHPETIYRYPTDSRSGPPLVPRHIHQIYLQEGRVSKLDRHVSAIWSCQNLHPDWKYTLWTDGTADAFMLKHYPLLYPRYIGYTQVAQRANLVRLAILDHFGGVYLDVDLTCRESLEPLRHLPFLATAADPAGINSAFIMSQPRHRFLGLLLVAARYRDLNWGLPYIQTFMTTGRGMLSSAWQQYVYERAHGEDIAREGVFVLGDEDGDIKTHMLHGAIRTPLFKHSVEHKPDGWNAVMIDEVGEHRSSIAMTIVYLGIFVIAVGLCVIAGQAVRSAVVRRDGIRQLPTHSEKMDAVKDS